MMYRDMAQTVVHARLVAHIAYHEHNDTCKCGTVGHLTAFITDRVLRELHPDWDLPAFEEEIW